jgi:putative flippase GtrA
MAGLRRVGRDTDLWGAMDLIRRFWHRDRITGQAARFMIVGVMNTVVDLIAFYLIGRIPGMPHTAAKGVSYVLGICNSFFWNKYWTFGARRSQQGKREFVVFFAVNLPPLLVNVVVFTVLGIWIQSGSAWMRMAKAFAAAIVATAWNFFGSRYIAFRHTAVGGKSDGAAMPTESGATSSLGGTTGGGTAPVNNTSNG